MKQPPSKPSNPNGAVDRDPVRAPEPQRDEFEGALRFLHQLGMQTKHDVHDNTVALYTLMEEMVARGQLDLHSLDARREAVRQREEARDRTRAHVEVADRVDKYALKDPPAIDCASLIPICKGRCCQLSFPISFQDLDERVVEWNYSRPYQIRKKSDGYCVHSSSKTRACQVYAQRPAICRTYDCRNDKRIWLDFENKIPAATDIIEGLPPHAGGDGP